MRVLLISSFPPVRCGVGDYASQLAGRLEASRTEVVPISARHLSPRAVRRRFEQSPDRALVHIQFPTVHFITNLNAQRLCLALRDLPLVVTVHEFSASFYLRRWEFKPFLLARHLIFTNRFEQLSFARSNPSALEKSSIIPVGSNIPFLGGAAEEKDPDRVAFFGLIRPNRGLEEFIALAALAQRRMPELRFEIVGTPQPATTTYFQRMRKASSGLPNLEWFSDLGAPEVARRLSGATYAYLHFPDGASERRTSLMAAMGNGLAVITSKGRQTPASLGGRVAFAPNPVAAHKQLRALRADAPARARMVHQSREWADQFNWPSIVEAHLRVYRQVLAP